MSGNHTLLDFSKTDKVILWLGFPLIGHGLWILLTYHLLQMLY